MICSTTLFIRKRVIFSYFIRIRLTNMTSEIYRIESYIYYQVIYCTCSPTPYEIRTFFSNLRASQMTSFKVGANILNIANFT